MATTTSETPQRKIWAYVYQILPHQSEGSVKTITAMLEHENAEARQGTGTWRARAVLEQQLTHILVVSDGPEQNRDANRHIEAELRAMNVSYEVTAPMRISDTSSGGDQD